MKNKTKLLAGRVGIYLFLVLRIYSIWSWVYRWLFERQYKHIKLAQVQSLEEARLLLRNVQYATDGWLELGDAAASPQKIQAIIDGTIPQQTHGADCLPGDTLVLMSDFSTKKISEVVVGDVIVGDGNFVKVERTLNKGIKPILEFSLNNGTTLRCTPDHKLMVVPKENGYANTNRDAAIEVLAKDVMPGDDLLTPQKMPEGTGVLDPEYAWLLGALIGDGWVQFSKKGIPKSVCLSGLDGWRKEPNKHRASKFCHSKNISTSWHRKYIQINDQNLAKMLFECGHLAQNKKLPSLNFSLDTLKNIKEGLDVDSDIRDGVFSSTSKELAFQYRILLRLLGFSSHFKTIVNHGGLGKNPIFRVTPRSGNTTKKYARVREVKSVDSVDTFDLTVEGGRFYLPENDVVVHNCDDFSCWLAKAVDTALVTLENPIQENEPGLWEAGVLTVTWMTPSGRYGGHNVCWLHYKTEDGDFYRYMDYGHPSEASLTLKETAYKVIDMYAPGSHLLAYAKQSCNFWVREVGLGP